MSSTLNDAWLYLAMSIHTIHTEWHMDVSCHVSTHNPHWMMCTIMSASQNISPMLNMCGCPPPCHSWQLRTVPDPCQSWHSLPKVPLCIQTGTATTGFQDYFRWQYSSVVSTVSHHVLSSLNSKVKTEVSYASHFSSVSSLSLKY